MEDEIVENFIDNWAKWWTRSCGGCEKTFFPRKNLKKYLRTWVMIFPSFISVLVFIGVLSLNQPQEVFFYLYFANFVQLVLWASWQPSIYRRSVLMVVFLFWSEVSPIMQVWFIWMFCMMKMNKYKLEKKNILCNTMCLTWKKWFFEKDNKKHEQNVVKSGLIIIPARREKSKWIGKDILRNSMRQYMCWIIVKSDFNVSMYHDFIKKWLKYYTCKECEDEVNRKGHLTKLQEAVHVDNVEYIIIKTEQNIILPILKHVWIKWRSLAQITGELKIIGTKSPSILFD